MRALRPVALAVLVVLTVAVPAAPVGAQEVGASEPVSGVSVDGEPGEPVSAGTVTTYKGATPIAAVASGTGWTFTVGTASPPVWSASVAPPVGQRLQPGTVYPTARSATEGAAGLDVRVQGRSCSSSTGTLAVHEAVLDEAGGLTAFSADYTQRCDTSSVTLHGALRYRAQTGFPAGRFNTTSSGVFGDVAVGTRKERVFHLASTGTEPLPVTSVVLEGDHRGDYELVRETCTAAPVAVGTTCAVTVAVTPTQAGTRAARILVRDGTVRGSRPWLLATTGVAPPSEPLGVTASTASDGVRLTWSPPAYQGSSTSVVGSYIVLRGTAPDTLAEVARTSHADRAYADVVRDGTAAGTTYHYAVQAVNMAGTGPRSAVVAGTTPGGEPVVVSSTSVLTVDGEPGTWVTGGTSATFVDGADGARVTMSPRFNGFQLTGSTAQHDYFAILASPTGRFTRGRHETGDIHHGSERHGLLVGGAGRACSGGVGLLDVTRADYSATGSLVGFAASYEYRCDAGGPRVLGELRWHDDTPFRAAELRAVEAGLVQLGQPRAVTATYRNTGSVALPVTSVAASGADWAVTRDGCSGTTVPAGGTCPVELSVTPTQRGERPGALRLVDGTALVSRERALTATGAGPPPAPVLVDVSTGTAGVGLTVSAPSDPAAPNTELRIYRGVTPDALALVATLPGHTTSWTDADVADGTHHYALTSVNALGEGPRSAVRQVALRLAPPTGLRAGVAARTAVLEWQPPATYGRTAFAGYSVYRGSTSGALTEVGRTAGTRFEVPLPAGTTAWFAVAARDTAGALVRTAPVQLSGSAGELVFVTTDRVSGRSRLVAAVPGEGPARVLDDGAGAWYLTDVALSPDGRRVAYVRADADGLSVRVRSVEGGGAVTVAAATDTADWSRPPLGAHAGRAWC